MKFKSGDIVKLKDEYGYWHSGEITIIKEGGMCKFLCDGDGPNYDYYHENELTKITPEERDDLLDSRKL